MFSVGAGGGAGQTASIDDKEVLDIMRLAETIQDAALLIRSHTRCSHRMTDRTRSAQKLIRRLHFRSRRWH